LDESGNFLEGYGELTGEYANNVADKVIDFLKEKDSLYLVEPCTHSYPHCWRCKTKCLFRLVENWFINCQLIKENLKKLSKEVNWNPDFVGKRMDDWLENMGDWMISRKRFYGLSLPFYECFKCKKLTVVGSKEELKALAINSEMVDSLPSLHRPWIDEIEIKCPNCGEKIQRIKDVGDCWLDAGVVPFSTLKYFEDKKYWEQWYPADLIGEMVEQVRLWYYSMLVYGCIFENKVPYKSVFNYVEVRDENGERMSKTKRNGIQYDEAVEKMGADVMRWMYITQNPVQNLNFGYSAADETRRKFHLLLWNIYNFFVTYANIDNFKIRISKFETTNILDKWIVSKLNNLIKSVTKLLGEYNAYESSRLIEEFVNDFSTWYIRRSRNRIGVYVLEKADKENCYKTIYYVFENLTKIMAPFVPFISEEIYTNLTENESVHLCDWPVFDKEKINEDLEQKMIIIKKICELGNAERKTNAIKNRQPLAKCTISNIQADFQDELLDLVKDELNIKKIEILQGQGEVKVELDINLTQELTDEGEARDIMRRIQEERKKLGCTLSEIVEVKIPNWPVEFEEEIKRKTQTLKLIKNETFEVKKINVSS
jgi:isoleucyl-tRNA synthetase